MRSRPLQHDKMQDAWSSLTQGGRSAASESSLCRVWRGLFQLSVAGARGLSSPPGVPISCLKV